MIKWYDRIGNSIEMKINNEWIKGEVCIGERTWDGIINMKTSTGDKYWCGVNGEYVYFRKCDNSDGDLITNADKIRSMSDEQLVNFLMAYSEKSLHTTVSEMLDNDYADKLPTEYKCVKRWLEKEF